MRRLGAPDFRKLYVAAQFAQLCQPHSRHYKPDWVSIACSPLTVDLILWIPPKHHKAILCPTLSHSIHLWDMSCRRWLLHSSHTPVAPLFSDPLFPPGMQPEVFGLWLNESLYRIDDYLDHRRIRPPSYFMNSLEMPSMENFHLQQIYHFFNT